MNFIKSLLSADRNSLSSKRLCGIIGWVCCSAVLVLCTIWDRQAPDMVTTFLIASSALLGVDSVTGIWKGCSDGNISNIKEKENEK